MPIAYSPCGRFGSAYAATEQSTKHPYILWLSEKYQKSPLQIMLAWGITRGYCVIPKASSEPH
jgi:diketogulonate reductase-like aldo/keto reductase